MATPNETWCNVPNKSISIFVSERRPRCDRISPQMRTFLLPDAFVSRPRCVRFSSQMRLSLLPDALKSIGLELRRIMRSSSTVEARKRRQRKLLRNAVLENRISELQECFGIQGFWDWQKVHGVKDWRHLNETAPKTNTSQDKVCFSIRCFYVSPSSSCRSYSNSITTKGATSNYTSGIHNQHWRWSQKGVDSERCQRCLY